MIYYHEIEDWNGKYAAVEIEYDYFPGSCPVMNPYGWDPGWLPEVEIIAVEVVHFERIDRRGMGDWKKDLDRLALEYIQDLDLDGEMIDHAE
jgi:hypothetical protein